MFERYEEKARRVIFFARYETSALGGDYIEPEHLVLGLFREWQWIRSAIASEAFAQLRSELEAGAQRGTPVNVCRSALVGGKQARFGVCSGRGRTPQLKTYWLWASRVWHPSAESETFASQWLSGQGLTVERIRESLRESPPRIATNTATVRALEVILETASERLDWTVKPAVRLFLK